MLATALGIVISARRRRRCPEIWWLLVVLSAAGAFLMFPPSSLLWRHLPELKFLQFPWRWLLPLNLAFAFFAAAAASRRMQWAWWVTLMCAIWAMGATIAGDTSWSNESVPELVREVRSGKGYEGIEEYQPLAAKVDELDDEGPLVGEFDPESGDIDEPEEAEVKVQKWSAENKVFDVKSDEPVTLALRLLNYPAWQVQVDGNRVTGSTATQTGQLMVSLSAGSHHVEVEFRRTTDRTIGLFISVLSIAGLLIPAGFMLRRSLLKTPSTAGEGRGEGLAED